ncbi:MAG: peptidyl-prolyl cis-trans isomerase [Opitutaceae bacterium]|jgi:peptidyl-prolyl cis-trans isomerase SurA|nr:peptidyl-prolyl cis-trans isomerase [Opitutaceae bacterium]
MSRLPTILTALLLLTAACPAQQDNLDGRYANGVVAVVEDKVITVEDLRREIGPRVPAVQQMSRNEKEFNERLAVIQEETIQELIDRAVVVKEFRKGDGEEGETRSVPASYIDNAISEELITRFDNDRSKFLGFLKAMGYTMREYRQKVEEDMIYGFMRGQQRKSANIVSPAKVERFYAENRDRFYQEAQVKLALIALNRKPGETDADLSARAAAVTARARAGEDFAKLAEEVSDDSKKSQGGDWGWQKSSDLKDDFSGPLFKLPKGGVADPVLMPDAAYILKAEDTKAGGIQPLSEARPEIERILSGMMARDAEERWLERLRRNAYIRIY